MWEAIQAGVWELCSWMIRSVVMKFMAYIVLFYLTTEVIEWLLNKINLDGKNFNLALSGLPQSVGYFFGLARVDVGFPMIMTAIFLRFCIRRIPLLN